MSSGQIGMLFDRALTPELLDTALRIATEAGGRPEARKLLTVALRDLVSGQEPEGKTKKCLSHIWVSPPEPAIAMIRWAVEHQHLDPQHTVLHLGALLATFPFAGVVCALVGRQLRLDGVVHAPTVRIQARVALGDRSTIDIGARKVVTTLRYLGLIEQSTHGCLSAPRRAVVPPELSAWFTHALLLSRQTSVIATDELSRAPELAILQFEQGIAGDYPMLETFSEAGRLLAVDRHLRLASSS